MDGEGFLLLTDSDMSEMIKPVGARRKLIVKRNYLTKPGCENSNVRHYSLARCRTFARLRNLIISAYGC